MSKYMLNKRITLICTLEVRFGNCLYWVHQRGKRSDCDQKAREISPWFFLSEMLRLSPLLFSGKFSAHDSSVWICKGHMVQ